MASSAVVLDVAMFSGSRLIIVLGLVVECERGPLSDSGVLAGALVLGLKGPVGVASIFVG